MKILIVDDSRVMRAVIRRCLAEAGWQSHAVLEAGDAETALQLIAEERPEVVLTDLYMPGLTGIEMLEEVRQRGLTMTVGFITSETHPDLKEVALAEGAHFVITKPPTVAALRQALAAVLG